MGTPSVFAVARDNPAFANVALIDRNKSVTTHLSRRTGQTFLADLFRDKLPAIAADVIVADPPWYVEHMRAFFWAAARLCHVGGHVVASLPPEGTRPHVTDELEQIFDWVREVGLIVEAIEEGALSYETPPFEKNALRASGIHLRSRSWRRGTLCVLKKVRDSDAARPVVQSRYDDWCEVDVLGTRIRIRTGTAAVGSADPRLVSCVPDDVLACVSRRNRLREYIDVWTSGNRVFQCQAPRLLHLIAQYVAKGIDPAAELTAVADRRSLTAITYAAKQIIDLAITERTERAFIGQG